MNELKLKRFPLKLTVCKRDSCAKALKTLKNFLEYKIFMKFLILGHTGYFKIDQRSLC